MKAQNRKSFWTLLLLTAVFVGGLSAGAFAQDVKPAAAQPTKEVAKEALLQPSTVQTLALKSKLMAREMPYRVVLPVSYSSSNETVFYPVIYLLHGLGGHFDNWTEKTKLAQYAAAYNVIIVTPEGGDGWYTNSVSAADDKYESYIVEELIPEIDKKFHTKTDRANRAIAGLSMGGYGAIKFGLKYPDKFILAGSFSGAIGITDLPAASKQFISVKNVFGEDDSQARKDNDDFRIIRDMPAEKLKGLPFLYVSCGTEDMLVFPMNYNFLKLLTEKRVKHEYRQLPGAHSWLFWDAQVQEFLKLSDKFFKK
ncbi:MAG TPA: alpha/beta hydrolase family protein [Pyrinomonadaceae bacterium]|jgi:S-formylglutathione hydrolase FrmB|nr:alpha/beta hydrolase family protein [Pyrinomonadaceae bacterium]